MKSALFPRSLVDVLLFGLLLWLAGNVGGYLLTRGIGKPLYAYIMLIVVAVYYVLAQAAARRPPDALYDGWTRRWILCMLVLPVYGALTFIESSQSAVAMQALITLCELALMAMAFTILLFNRRRVQQAAAAMALLALFAACLNVYDFLVPTFSGVPGRAAGLYLDPNISGTVLAMLMLCGISAIPNKLRWSFVAACGIGVVVTFSRGSWIVWGLGVAWLGWQAGKASPRRRLAVALFSTMLGVSFVLGIFSGALGGLLVQTGLVHYLDSNTLARLGVGASSLSGFSSHQRLEAALYALHVFPNAPLLGHGIGYINEWGFPKGPHNMYLRFLAEGGLVGLLLYLALMWVLWSGSVGLGRVVALQVLIAGVFSQTMLNQPAVGLIISFVLVRSAVLRREQRDTAMIGARWAEA